MSPRSETVTQARQRLVRTFRNCVLATIAAMLLRWLYNWQSTVPFIEALTGASILRPTAPLAVQALGLCTIGAVFVVYYTLYLGSIVIFQDLGRATQPTPAQRIARLRALDLDPPDTETTADDHETPLPESDQ